jgi:hypothetical protein
MKPSDGISDATKRLPLASLWNCSFPIEESLKDRFCFLHIYWQPGDAFFRISRIL